MPGSPRPARRLDGSKGLALRAGGAIQARLLAGGRTGALDVLMAVASGSDAALEYVLAKKLKRTSVIVRWIQPTKPRQAIDATSCGNGIILERAIVHALNPGIDHVGDVPEHDVRAKGLVGEQQAMLLRPAIGKTTLH